MKKIYTIALICIPFCLILGFGALKAIGVGGQQQPMGGYSMENEKISMLEVGKLLERLGKEIQQNQSVTVGGKTYPVKGEGGIEFKVNQRQPGQTGIKIEFGTRGEVTRSRGNTYVAYIRAGQRGVVTEEFADIMSEIGKNLASTNSFVIDDHKVAMKGEAPITINQRVTESVRRGRGQDRPFNYIFDVTFGDVRFPIPTDEQNDVTEYEEAIRAGWVKEHAIKETGDVDLKTVAKLFEALSADLKAGKASVGSKSFDVGENLQFGIMHSVTTEGDGHRIRISFRFGEVTPRGKRRAGARYSKEFFDEPMKNVAAMLKRIGTEILKMGTFKLGENEFRVKELADYEIQAGQQGFSIELRYVEPLKKEK